MIKFIPYNIMLNRILTSTALTINFINNCTNNISLYDNVFIKDIEVNKSHKIQLQNAFDGIKFKNGKGNSATLAEFATSSMGIWYDISIIPTSDFSGPGHCKSLIDCQIKTHASGFNTPMKIKPLFNSSSNDRCSTLICLKDGCQDAYNYPSDDTKTHVCPLETTFEIIFCPIKKKASHKNIIYNNIQNIPKYLEKNNKSVVNLTLSDLVKNEKNVKPTPKPSIMQKQSFNC